MENDIALFPSNQTRADEKRGFLDKLSNEGGPLHSLKSFEEPDEDGSYDEQEYYWEGVILSMERWVKEQPQKMTDLHFLVQRINPDIVLFLDTSARPSGLLYKHFRDLLETPPGVNRPHIEFASPGTRPEEIDVDGYKGNSAGKVGETQSLQEKVSDALKRRFAATHYSGKSIMIVDESSSTGKQMAFVKSAIEAAERKVVTVSLGHDDKGFDPELAKNADYVLGRSMMSPWSKAVGAVDEDAKGIRKATLHDFMTHQQNNPERIPPTTYKLDHLHAGDRRVQLRSVLRPLARSCVEYSQKFASPGPSEIEVAQSIEKIYTQVADLENLAKSEKTEREKLDRDDEYLAIRKQYEVAKNSVHTIDSRAVAARLGTQVRDKERVLLHIHTLKEAVNANERIKDLSRSLELNTDWWVSMHVQGKLHKLIPTLTIMATAKTDNSTPDIVKSLLILAEKETSTTLFTNK